MIFPSLLSNAWKQPETKPGLFMEYGTDSSCKQLEESFHSCCLPHTDPPISYTPSPWGTGRVRY